MNNVINGKADTVFAIKRSNLVKPNITTCETKLQESFFVAMFLWRHLIVSSLHYTTDTTSNCFTLDYDLP